MNRIVHLVPQRSFPSERLATAARDALVKEMADHLVAAVVEGLSTANTMDVFKCLYDSPDRYHHRVVNDYMDDALALAKTILDEMYQARYERQHAAVAAEMSEG
jgi:hypothetical protein